MKKIGLFAVILALATAFTLSNMWTAIDKDNIKVNFKLNKEGTKGTFTGVETSFEFDENDLAKSSLKATVKVKTLSTENKKRDQHLLGDEFFDEAKFPTIVFKSSSIEKSKSGYTANGKLTMKGQTLDVKVPFTFEKDKGGNSLLKGSMTVNPYKFGVIKDSKMKEETVSISVEIPFKK
ncbi:MAG: YceI family protein [Bacteroidota bacterium]